MASALQFATAPTDASPLASIPQSAQTTTAVSGNDFGGIFVGFLSGQKKSASGSSKTAENQCDNQPDGEKDSKRKSNSTDAANSAAVQVALLPQLAYPMPSPTEVVQDRPATSGDEESGASSIEPLQHSAPASGASVLPEMNRSNSAEEWSAASSPSSVPSRAEVRGITDLQDTPQRNELHSSFHNIVDHDAAQTTSAKELGGSDLQPDGPGMVADPADAQHAFNLNSESSTSIHESRNLIPAMQITSHPLHETATETHSASRANTDDATVQILQTRVIDSAGEHPQAAQSSQWFSQAKHLDSATDVSATVPAIREEVERSPIIKPVTQEPRVEENSAKQDSAGPRSSEQSSTHPRTSTGPFTVVPVQFVQAVMPEKTPESENQSGGQPLSATENKAGNAKRQFSSVPFSNRADASADVEKHSLKTGTKRSTQETTDKLSADHTLTSISQDDAVAAAVTSPGTPQSSMEPPTASGNNTSVANKSTATYEYPAEHPGITAQVRNHASVARLLNRTADIEMRIGLSTSAFGSIEVRTVVHATDVGVQIGSERGDLRSMIATELPNLAHSLEQQNLRLSHVEFHNAGSAMSSDSGSGANSQPRNFTARTETQGDAAPDFFSQDTSDYPESRYWPEGLNVLA